MAIPSRTAIKGLKLPILAATGIMCLLTNAFKPPLDLLLAIIIPCYEKYMQMYSLI